MRTCPSCGATHEDTVLTCPFCGMILASESTEKKVKSNPGKFTISVRAAVIAAIVLLVAIISLLATFSLPRITVMSAAKRSADRFLKAVDAHSGIVTGVDTVTKALKIGEYTVGVAYETNDIAITATYGLSQIKKVGSGRIAVEVPDVDFDIQGEFTLNNKEITFSFPEQSGYIYGFRFKDLSREYSKSFLYSLLPIEIPEKLSFKSFSLQDLQWSLNRSVSRDIDQLKDSLDVTRIGKQSVLVNGETQIYIAYRVEWSKAKQEQLLKDLAKSTEISESLRNLVSQLYPSCICYVDSRDGIRGLDFTFGGTQYVLLLEGEANPWDTFTLTKKSLTGNDVKYYGGFERENGVSSLYLGSALETLLRAEYDENSHRYQIQTKTLGTVLQGELEGDGGSFRFSADLLPGTGEEGKLEIILGKLAGFPESVPKNYIDIFKMNMGDIQRLLIDLGVKLS